MLSSKELASILVDRASVELDVLGHLADLAVGSECEVAADDDGEELRDDKHLLELDTTHSAALDPSVDFGKVHSLDRIHGCEAERTLEGFPEDDVENGLTLGELHLVAMGLRALLYLDLCLGWAGRAVLEDINAGCGNRTLVGAGHGACANLVEELFHADELLEVGAELLWSWCDASGEHSVEPLLVDRELLGLDALVLLGKDEGRCAERGVDDLAEEPIVQLLDRIEERRESANLPGVALLDGIWEPNEALVHCAVRVLLLEEELALTLRWDHDMRDAAGPRDFLDEGVDDVQVLELLLLSECVAADHGDRLLNRGGAPIESGLVLGVRSVEEDFDEPLLDLWYIPSLSRRDLRVVEQEPEVGRADRRLEHDDLMLRRDDRTVGDEPDLPSVERDRAVVKGAGPRDRA